MKRLANFIAAAAFGLTGAVAAQDVDDPASVPEALSPAGPNLVIWGGVINTGDETNPTIEAVAVTNGLISHVGSRAEIEALVTDATTVLDLDGAALFPGFTDAHAHLAGIGARELSLNLDQATSIEDLLARLSDWMARHDEPVIMGRGWIETHWPENRAPSRFDLDRVAPSRPVILTRADGHALVANSAALNALNITPNTPVPAGGAIHQNALGELTGILVDAAMGLTQPLRPERSLARQREELITGARVYAERGWTGLHNMSVPLSDAQMLTSLSAEGAVGIRVYNALNESDGDAILAAGPQFSADGRIITRAIKLYVDGALGSRGAALLQPYSDADTDGLLLIEEARALDIMTRSLRAGIQVNTHAIGDRANRLLLDWVAEAQRRVPASMRRVEEPRFRNEHTQIVDPTDIPRFAEIGLIPSMQPSHAIGDLHFASDRLGEERLDGAYAWRALIDTGSIIAGGSDAPVEVGSPLIEFYAAVARADLEGFQGEDWRADQAVSRLEALKMFTLWPAIASFQESRLGSISVGKAADFSAFSIDLMTAELSEIPLAEAVLTVVDGTIVYLASESQGEMEP